MLSKQRSNSTNSVLEPNIDSDESLLAKSSEVGEIGRGDSSGQHDIPHIQSEIEVGSAGETRIKEEFQLQDIHCTLSRIQMEWKDAKGISAGLLNMGNTCFLNSALQCLTYTAPLSNYLSSGEHGTNCLYAETAGFCMVRELRDHMRRCQEKKTAIAPASIINKN